MDDVDPENETNVQQRLHECQAGCQASLKKVVECEQLVSKTQYLCQKTSDELALLVDKLKKSEETLAQTRTEHNQKVSQTSMMDSTKSKEADEDSPASDEDQQIGKLLGGLSKLQLNRVAQQLQSQIAGPEKLHKVATAELENSAMLAEYAAHQEKGPDSPKLPIAEKTTGAQVVVPALLAGQKWQT